MRSRWYESYYQDESGSRIHFRKKKRRQSSQPSPAASSTASNITTPKSGRKLKKLKRTPIFGSFQSQRQLQEYEWQQQELFGR